MPLLPFGKSPLQKALDRAAAGSDLSDALSELGDYVVRSKRDADAVVDALARIPRMTKRPLDRYRTSPVHHLTAFFQSAEDDAVKVFRARGIAELTRIFDASFPPEEDDDDDLLFIIKILAMYGAPELTRIILAAVRDPAVSEQFLWSVIFEQIDPANPAGEEILRKLSDPLADGFAGIAFLDFSNRRALEGRSASHPFNTQAGIARLERFLTDSDPDHYSYAHSATAAIPFVDAAAQPRLLELASHHPDQSVRLESSWALAKLGDERGVQQIAEASRDPRNGLTALQYLEELGRLDAAPPETQTKDFLALAEFAQWLAYPTEMGRAPDRMHIMDTRELFWPPTDDRRQVWLISYEYDGEKSGVGMVGSITFVLFGETTTDLAAEDIYGLHCAWELEMNRDPRAPSERTAEAGRKILGI